MSETRRAGHSKLIVRDGKIVPEKLTDTQLLDWLEDFLQGGCFEACFEMDGGINAKFSPIGEQELSFRDQDTLRDILQRVAKDNPLG
jgi:hypothetical protein